MAAELIFSPDSVSCKGVLTDEASPSSHKLHREMGSAHGGAGVFCVTASGPHTADRPPASGRPFFRCAPAVVYYPFQRRYKLRRRRGRKGSQRWIFMVPQLCSSPRQLPAPSHFLPVWATSAMPARCRVGNGHGGSQARPSSRLCGGQRTSDLVVWT